MALYMGQPVDEMWTVQLEQAARSSGAQLDATSQNVLDAMAAAGVTTLQQAYDWGRRQLYSNVDPQLIAAAPDVQQSVVETAGTAGFSDLRFRIGSSTPTISPSYITPGNFPGLVMGPTMPGGMPSGSTGLPSTGVDWLDGLINFGAGFIPQLQQPRSLPMPGGGGAPPALPPAPRLPTGGGTGGRGIVINIGGRPRTISAATMGKVVAAAAALGLTVEQYLQQFGVPPSPRRMNPLNPRALTRALRRSNAFASFAKRTIDLTTCHKWKVGKTKKRGKCR